MRKTDAYQAIQRPVLWRLRPGERRVVLLLGDLTATLAATLISLYFWSIQDDYLDFSMRFLRERIPGWFYLLPFIWLILLVELYDLRRASRQRETIRGLIIAAAASLGLYLLVFFLSEQGSLPRLGVGIFILSTFLLTLFWRSIYLKVFTAPLFMRRVMIVGAGRAGSTLLQVVSEIWPPPFFLVGLIDDDEKKIGTKIENYPVLGGSDQLMKIIKDQNVTDLVFAISGEMNSQMFQALITAEEQGITVTTMPIIYEEVLGRVPIFLLQSDWILRSFFDQIHAGDFFEFTKRLMDLLGGVIGVGIMILLFPFISLGIALDSGFPIFYLQSRLGKNGNVYKIIKFRTMQQDAEIDGQARMATENDGRVTRFGRFLRKSHLDELPQFINVLRGDMSLVGPRAERPQLVNELQKHIPFYRARLLVKPGLTGWAQINYGYASTIEETGIKLEYDLYYIKHRNVMLDMSILLRTVGTVVGFRGQ